MRSPLPCSDSSATPSSPSQLEWMIGLLPSIFPSTRVFSNESTLRMRWPKYWSFMTLGTKDTPKTQEESILKAGSLGCPQGRQSPLRTEICGESSLRSSKAMGTWWQTIPLLQAETPSSRTQLCPTVCDPMNRSTPGLPVHHQLPEFTQTHVH